MYHFKKVYGYIFTQSQRGEEYMKMFTMFRNCIGLAAVTVLAMILYIPAIAIAETDHWQNEVTVYGWFSDISGTTNNGAELTYEVEDILEDLQMIFMGGYEGRYGRWSIIADLVYLDVSEDSNTTVPAGPATVDLELSTLLAGAAVGYDLVHTDGFRVAAVAGMRYLDIEVKSDLSIGGSSYSSSTRSQDGIDGIIGIRGNIKLGDQFFLPFYADIGTGDSDLSYQVFVGIGYAFGWGDIRLGYRYLTIELEDNSPMEDLTINGPVLGAGFRF